MAKFAMMQLAVEMCPASMSAIGLDFLSMAAKKSNIWPRVAGAAFNSMRSSFKSSGYFSFSKMTSWCIFEALGSTGVKS